MDPTHSAVFQTEGAPAFPTDTGEQTPAGSPPENKDEKGTPSSTGGENNQPPKSEENVPFHKHPAWLRREQEWNDKFAKTQEEIAELKKGPPPTAKDNRSDDIPPWFGGDEDQWKAYQADQDTLLTKAEERAFKRMESARTEAEKKQAQLQAEAQTFFQSELAAIEADRMLNPAGDKLDPNKLLKFVLDLSEENPDLVVDRQGRWNWRAGFALMQLQSQKKGTSLQDKKNLIGATTSEPTAETKPSAFRTSADFKKNKPW